MIKDKAISFSIKQFINLQIKEFGEMLKLNIDSKNKKISLEVMLLGEKEPLSVDVNRYELFQKEDKHFIKLKDIQTSREWINILIKNHFRDKEIEIPPNIAKTLKIII